MPSSTSKKNAGPEPLPRWMTLGFRLAMFLMGAALVIVPIAIEIDLLFEEIAEHEHTIKVYMAHAGFFASGAALMLLSYLGIGKTLEFFGGMADVWRKIRDKSA